MIFTADITTKEAPLSLHPQKTILKITSGLIYKIEVEFPTGPCGLLYTNCYDGLHPVWPSSLNTWFHSDGMTIGFDDLLLKTQPPFELQIFTDNIDDTYPHWCQWRIGMVSQEVFIARFLPTYEYEYFKKMLQEMAEEERARAEGSLEKPFSWI